MAKSLDVLIAPDRLRLLEAKERAHDDYLSALKVMRAKAGDIDLQTQRLGLDQSYSLGYRQALKDFALAILRASESRNDG
jgi:hypothetical protein